MAANSGWNMNLAKLDPTTGAVEWNRNVHPHPVYYYITPVNQMVAVGGTSGDMFLSTMWSTYSTISRLDKNGSGIWSFDGIYDLGPDLKTFGYDAVNDIIVWMYKNAFYSYELRGIDATTGASIWTRSFPAYPNPAIDSVLCNGTQCIVCMQIDPFGGLTPYKVRSIDTTTGADIWTHDSATQLRVEAVDSAGDWLCAYTGGAVEKRSGTTGAVIATSTYSEYSAFAGPGGYSIADLYGTPPARATSGLTLAGGFSVTTAFGATLVGQYGCCSEPGPNYYWVGPPTTLPGGGKFNVLKTDGSGTPLWYSLTGILSPAMALQCCAVAGDGALWVGGWNAPSN